MFVKCLRLLVLAVVLVLALSACSPAASQGFVQLPEDVRVGIGALVLVVVSWVFARLLALVPFLKFLDEYRLPVAAGLAAVLVDFIQNSVPDAYGAVAILALQLVLAVFALFVTFERLRLRAGNKLF